MSQDTKHFFRPDRPTKARSNMSTDKYTTDGQVYNENQTKSLAPTVIHSSKHHLTSAQRKVLELGLSFFPTSRACKFDLGKDVVLFARKLHLKMLHSDEVPFTKGHEPWKNFTTQDYIEPKNSV